jgi:hypothetical protein
MKARKEKEQEEKGKEWGKGFKVLEWCRMGEHSNFKV